MLRSGWDELNVLGQAGDWAFFNKGRKIVVKWGRAMEQVVELDIHRAGEVVGGRTWEWDGEVEVPTLVEKIEAEGWSGWLRAGKLVE